MNMKQKNKLGGMEFTHFIIAEDDKAIFASARAEGKIENFLIDTEGRWVKHQVNRHFENLPYELGKIITKKAESFYGKAKVYRISSFDFLS